MIIDIQSSVVKIKGFLGKSTIAILDVGRELDRLNKQKKNLKGSQKKEATLEIATMYKDHLPFGEKVGSKFIAISRDKVICYFANDLTKTYTVLYELRDLSKADMQFLIESGLNPLSTLKNVEALKELRFPNDDDKEDDGIKVKSAKPKTRKTTELSETSEDKSDKSETSTGGVEKSSADTQTSSADSKKNSKQSTKTESTPKDKPQTSGDGYMRFIVVRLKGDEVKDFHTKDKLVKLRSQIEDYISESEFSNILKFEMFEMPTVPELPPTTLEVSDEKDSKPMKKAKEVYTKTTKKVA